MKKKAPQLCQKNNGGNRELGKKKNMNLENHGASQPSPLTCNQEMT